ncbi:hypothetical protein HN51_012960 [Arachis hypogaea]
MSEALRRTVASLENLEAELPNMLSLSNPFILSKKWLFYAVQRKKMANMSIGEVPTMSNYQEQAGQKRKHPSSEEHPVQVYSEVHVKKEPLEVFGHNNGKTEEPIVIDISDDDE